MNYPGGHKFRPYEGTDPRASDQTANMICRNCAEVNPEPGSDCTDD
jgi:hypothetical protein